MLCLKTSWICTAEMKYIGATLKPYLDYYKLAKIFVAMDAIRRQGGSAKLYISPKFCLLIPLSITKGDIVSFLDQSFTLHRCEGYCTRRIIKGSCTSRWETLSKRWMELQGVWFYLFSFSLSIPKSNRFQFSFEFFIQKCKFRASTSVSYTHLTLPTIYSV